MEYHEQLFNKAADRKIVKTLTWLAPDFIPDSITSLAWKYWKTAYSIWSAVTSDYEDLVKRGKIHS